jgi:hypothetical protein
MGFISGSSTRIEDGIVCSRVQEQMGRGFRIGFRSNTALTRSLRFHTVPAMTTSLSLDQLKQAVHFDEQIDALEAELNSILGGAAPAPAPTVAAVSPRHRANERRLQKLRLRRHRPPQRGVAVVAP